MGIDGPIALRPAGAVAQVTEVEQLLLESQALAAAERQLRAATRIVAQELAAGARAADAEAAIAQRLSAAAKSSQSELELAFNQANKQLTISGFKIFGATVGGTIVVDLAKPVRRVAEVLWSRYAGSARDAVCDPSPIEAKRSLCEELFSAASSLIRLCREHRLLDERTWGGSGYFVTRV